MTKWTQLIRTKETLENNLQRLLTLNARVVDLNCLYFFLEMVENWENCWNEKTQNQRHTWHGSNETHNSYCVRKMLGDQTLDWNVESIEDSNYHNIALNVP